jgi:hypothetical protein
MSQGIALIDQLMKHFERATFRGFRSPSSGHGYEKAF